MRDYERIINKYPGYTETCPITDMRSGCITFARNEEFLRKADFSKDSVILVDACIKNPSSRVELVNNVDYTFTMVHNILSLGKQPAPDFIGNGVHIHPTAVLGVEGLHVAKAPDGTLVQMHHMGNIVADDKVIILAFATIQRAVFGTTMIGRGTFIDTKVHISHNVRVGRNCAIAAGAVIAGSAVIGNNCKIGIGALVRNHVSICGDTVIGQGANVVSDITEPGIYVGSPAKFLKPCSKDWNF
jgi:acetyltransferase-like isoleucine patch superfamily enzyme